MLTKTLLKFGLILFLVVAASVFGFKTVRAALPVEAGFGEACGTGVAACQYPFFCDSSGKCVECVSADHCDSQLNEACTGGICTLPSGNNAGDLCASSSNCKSGLTCGTRGICEVAATVSATPSVSVTPSPSVSMVPAGSGSNWMGIDLSIQDVANIINGLACWLTRIATAIMVIFLVIAGLRFMNARGNPTAYQTAVKNFQHVLIGILVIIAVYVIIATVAHAVGRTDFSLIPLVC